jgi:capsular exopolysaccharide synthesis family protein
MQVEPPVQLGPAAANLLRSIWRQRTLVLIGLVLGVALGLVLLPRVFTSTSTYEATIRISVRQSPVDAILQVPPAFGGAGQEGASTDALKDMQVAEAVLKSRRLTDEMTGPELLGGLSFTPVAGTPLIDVTYAHGDAKLAPAIVDSYATILTDRRNAAERERLTKVIDFYQDFADRQSGSAKQAAEQRLNEATFALQALPLASVVGDPVLATSGPPLSRPVILAIGLMLGLAVGVGAALLVETAFPNVVTPSDAEEASELALVGTVRKNGVRRTPLPVIDRPFSPAAEDYRRVGTALERQGLGGDIQVLAVASADAGDGKTMLAANLAHSLARQGRAVVLVSSDLRQPQVEKLLGLGQLPGLAEALQDDPLPAIALLVSINDHLLVLPAGLPSKHPGELLASRRLHETIQTLRQMGVVILDTPPARLSADAIALSSVADATLLVARSGATKKRSLREATTGLRRDRIRQLGVVLVGTTSPLFRSLSRRADGYRELAPEPELEEPGMAGPQRPLSFNPRPSPGPPRQGHDSPNGDVTDLGAAEHNRRAVE